MVDIGGYGRDNDATLLEESQFGKAFENNELTLPEPRQEGENMLPYCLIGDPIFPLKPWLMKAYGGHNLSEEERVYNYRLARARRIFRRIFSTAKWRIFCRPVRATVCTSESIIKVAICLHSYLQITANAMYIPQGFVDSEDNTGDIQPGEWRSIVADGQSSLSSISRQGSNRYGFEPSNIRSKLQFYCNSLEGSVP